MPTPICNDQTIPGDSPCQHPATVVVHLLDTRYFADQDHAKLTMFAEPRGRGHLPHDLRRRAQPGHLTEGDQPHTATVIALPDGSTGLRLVSPQAELRCLTCGTVEFKVRATGTVWIKVERVELAKLVTVPLSIELDTEEGTVTAVKVLDQRGDRPPAFTARAATAPMPTWPPPCWP